MKNLKQKIYKSIHVLSTGCFLLSLSYLMVKSLRNAGVNWWVIFSFSGPSAAIGMFLLLFYLFAIFRGVSSGKQALKEHPLTSSHAYMAFYVGTPLFGMAAGLLGTYGVGFNDEYFTGIAMGTLGATTVVWLFLDPLAGLLEMQLPTSKQVRALRVVEEKKESERVKHERKLILENAIATKKCNKTLWEGLFRGEVEVVNSMFAQGEEVGNIEEKVVELGMKAWQSGGLPCMKEIYNLLITMCTEGKHYLDFVPQWWDGIGSWRCPNYGEKF